MLERKFQADLISELKETFPGCFVLKNDPNYIQGIPDLLILFGNRWAALEVKNSMYAHRQANQQWYVERFNEMSCAYVIYPENRDEVINQLRDHFEYWG